jgi:hypothetical protein
METYQLLKEKKILFVSRKELRTLKASDYSDGDIIRVSKYYIHIIRKKYSRPSLESFVEDSNFKVLDCTPGVGRPYYIDDFLGR